MIDADAASVVRYVLANLVNFVSLASDPSVRRVLVLVLWFLPSRHCQYGDVRAMGNGGNDK